MVVQTRLVLLVAFDLITVDSNQYSQTTQKKVGKEKNSKKKKNGPQGHDSGPMAVFKSLLSGVYDFAVKIEGRFVTVHGFVFSLFRQAHLRPVDNILAVCY